jgi:DTW domain-containing protein YfiP
MHVPLCLCGDVVPVPTRTQFLIVRHHGERERSSNSGRLAALAMPSCRLVDFGTGGVPFDNQVIPRDGVLLFPDGAAADRPPAPPPSTVIVMDATWHQARRMRQRISGLRGLPVWRLPDRAVTAARMRASPGPGMLSTLEAIAEVVRQLEGEVLAQRLEALFALAVSRAERSGRRISHPATAAP